jgi:GLPGLI family protein
MKKKLFFGLIIILVLSYVKTYSQKNSFLRITYEKDYYVKIDTVKTKFYQKKISKLNTILSKISRDVSYELTIANHHSSFTINKIKMNTTNSNLKDLAGSLGGTTGIFYINKQDAIYLNKKHFSGEDFLVKLNLKDWKITSDTKLINDFKCYKAISEDVVKNYKGTFKFKVVAWFTPDLPSFFGPAGYFGLPGLILELDNSKVNLRASKIQFTKFEKIDEKPFNKGVSISEGELEKFIKEQANQMFGKSFKNK